MRCAVALAPPRLSQTTHPGSADRAATREFERELLIRYHEFGDLAAREELVERFLPLARDLALRGVRIDEQDASFVAFSQRARQAEHCW